MPKISTICRNSNNYQKKYSGDIEKVIHNPNPSIHPQFKAREYMRAIKAAKLSKIFAKPFLYSLSEHTEGIKTMSKNPKLLNQIVSGSFDGQIILWDLIKKEPIFNINSNQDLIKSIVYNKSGNMFLSIDNDKIKIWNINNLYNQKNNSYSNIKNTTNNISLGDLEINNYNNFNSNINYNNYNNNKIPMTYEPSKTVYLDSGFESIDYYSYNPNSNNVANDSVFNNYFATAGGVVALWDLEREEKPILTYNNGKDSFLKVKFSYTEENLLLATAIDRSIILYDMRIKSPSQQVVLKNKSASACWNPQIPFYFTVGNEDSNCYTFDIRRLDKVNTIHKDHLLSVLDIDYSPTGREFVSGSFDKTVRLFNFGSGKSKEIYYNKRMQK